MTHRMLAAGALLLLAASCPAHAHDYKAGELTIDHPMSRPSAARNGAVYMTIENKGAAPDRLVAASTPRAGKAELHTHIMDGDIMRMRQVEAIDLPAGGKAELKPGGFHVMLLGLTAPLKEGDRYTLTLEFQKAGKVPIEVWVEKPGAADGSSHRGHGQPKKP